MRKSKEFTAFLKQKVDYSQMLLAFNQDSDLQLYLTRWAKYHPYRPAVHQTFTWLPKQEANRLQQKFIDSPNAQVALRKETAKLAEVVTKVATIKAQIGILEEKQKPGVSEAENIRYLTTQATAAKAELIKQDAKVSKLRQAMMVSLMNIPYPAKGTDESISKQAMKKRRYLYDYFDEQVAEITALKSDKQVTNLLRQVRNQFPGVTVPTRHAANELVTILAPLKGNPATEGLYNNMIANARALEKSLSSSYLKENDRALRDLQSRWSILYDSNTTTFSAYKDASVMVQEMINLYKDRAHLLSGASFVENQHTLLAWKKFQWEFDNTLAKSVFNPPEAGKLKSVGSQPSGVNHQAAAKAYEQNDLTEKMFDKLTFMQLLQGVVKTLGDKLQGKSSELTQNEFDGMHASKMDMKRMQAITKNVMNVINKNNKDETVGLFKAPKQFADTFLANDALKTVFSTTKNHVNYVQLAVNRLRQYKGDAKFIAKMQDVLNTVATTVEVNVSLSKTIHKSIAEGKSTQAEEQEKLATLKTALSDSEKVAKALSDAVAKTAAHFSGQKVGPTNFMTQLKSNVSEEIRLAFPNGQNTVSGSVKQLVADLNQLAPANAPKPRANPAGLFSNSQGGRPLLPSEQVMPPLNSTAETSNTKAPGLRRTSSDDDDG